MYLLRSPMRRVCSGYNLSWTPRTPRTPRRLLIRCPSCLGTLVSTLWSGSSHGVHHHGWSAPMDCIRLPIRTSDWWRERRYTVRPDVGGLPRTASLWSNSAVLRYWRIQQRRLPPLRPGCVRAASGLAFIEVGVCLGKGSPRCVLGDITLWLIVTAVSEREGVVHFSPSVTILRFCI